MPLAFERFRHEQNRSKYLRSRPYLALLGPVRARRTSKEGADHMKKRQACLGGPGDAVVNPGTQLGKSRIVSAAGVSDDGGANPMSGFSVAEMMNMT